ncbi:hypothetical protein F4801DRAFT_595134 [Xylaria longipes]|nr:hypothetical protein F4801DRAFT_595134 [Xylaria longipes]RYC55390.1 hypothetical protein CHU98_g10819 [Xylaria longipes]
MRASVLTLLSAAAVAKAAIEPAIIVIEKSLGNRYQNVTAVEVHAEYDFTDPELLNQVSSLYQIGPDVPYFCFAYKPDGTFYSDEWFGLDKPLRLSTNNVVVKAITCRLE